MEVEVEVQEMTKQKEGCSRRGNELNQKRNQIGQR